MLRSYAVVKQRISEDTQAVFYSLNQSMMTGIHCTVHWMDTIAVALISARHLVAVAINYQLKNADNYNFLVYFLRWAS